MIRFTRSRIYHIVIIVLMMIVNAISIESSQHQLRHAIDAVQQTSQIIAQVSPLNSDFPKPKKEKPPCGLEVLHQSAEWLDTHGQALTFSGFSVFEKTQYVIFSPSFLRVLHFFARGPPLTPFN